MKDVKKYIIKLEALKTVEEEIVRLEANQKNFFGRLFFKKRITAQLAALKKIKNYIDNPQSYTLNAQDIKYLKQTRVKKVVREIKDDLITVLGTTFHKNKLKDQCLQEVNDHILRLQSELRKGKKNYFWPFNLFGIDKSKKIAALEKLQNYFNSKEDAPPLDENEIKILKNGKTGLALTDYLTVYKEIRPTIVHSASSSIISSQVNSSTPSGIGQTTPHQLTPQASPPPTSLLPSIESVVEQPNLSQIDQIGIQSQNSQRQDSSILTPEEPTHRIRENSEMIDRCLANLDIQNFDPALKNALKDYVENELKRSAIKVKNPLDPQLRTLESQKEGLQQAFKQLALDKNVTLLKDYFDEPLLFDQINEFIKDHEKQLKIEMLKAFYPDREINSIASDDAQLRTKHMSYIGLLNSIASVNRKVGFLIENARVEGMQVPSFQLVYPNKFKITASDLAMGYSMHLIRCYALDSSPESNPYNGELSIEIDQEELKKWEEYLKELRVWHEDFYRIMRGLIGSDVNAYVKTSQKPFDQIIQREDLARIPNAAIRKNITDSAFTKMKRALSRQAITLLPTQIALDFTNHRNRDQLRDLFESMYSEADLKANNSRPKTFVVLTNGDKTYLSGLAIIQLEQIFTNLMANTLVACKAREMGFESQFDENFLASFPTKNDLLDSYFEQLLRDASIGEAFLQVTANASALQLVSAFTQSLHTMLDENTGILVRSQGQSQEREISAAEKKALLPIDAQFEFPQNSVEVNALFTKLLQCEAYKNARDALIEEGTWTYQGDEPIERLRNQFIEGLASHQQNQFFGREQALSASEYAMAWIAKIVYQEKSKVTDESIQRSLKKVIAITSRDTIATPSYHRDGDLDGCNRGLWGRSSDIALQLNTKEDDFMLQTFKQTLRDNAEEEFGKLPGMQHSESSMYAIYKAQAFMRLGLMPYRELKQDERPMPADDMNMFLQAVSFRMKPSVILEEITKAAISNIKMAISDKRDDDVYALLQQCGFTENLTGKISDSEKQKLDIELRLTPAQGEEHLDMPWNFSLISIILPSKLPQVFIKKGLLQRQTTNMKLQVSNFRQEQISPNEIPRPQVQQAPLPYYSSSVQQPQIVSQPQQAGRAAQQSSGVVSWFHRSQPRQVPNTSGQQTPQQPDIRRGQVSTVANTGLSTRGNTSSA